MAERLLTMFHKYQLGTYAVDGISRVGVQRVLGIDIQHLTLQSEIRQNHSLTQCVIYSTLKMKTKYKTKVIPATYRRCDLPRARLM